MAWLILPQTFSAHSRKSNGLCLKSQRNKGVRSRISWGSDLFVVDTFSGVVSTIAVGPNSYSGGVDVTPDGAYAYVTTSDEDEDTGKLLNSGVKVIDTATTR